MEKSEEKRLYTAADLHVVTLVAAACRYPRIYTLDGTFQEVVAFLEGFYAALEWRRAAPDEVAEWKSVCEWLSGKLQRGPSERYFEALRRAYPEDGAALAQLATLWSEYRSRKPS
jgi:hypothetical protein